MSGPKCGQAELNRQREEELRRQREREERIRNAHKGQKRDGQRQEAIQQAAQSAWRSMEEARSAFGDARAGVVAQYAAGELREWERMLQATQQEFERVQAAFTRAQQQFNSAAAAWRSNNEYYQGGHFDRLEFAEAQQRAEAAVQHSQQIVSIAEARREEERIQREFERRQAEAQAALIQAQAARSQFAALPHAKLAPGAADVIDRQIAQAILQIQQGDFEAASQTARQARERCETQAREVQAAFATWQTRFEAARSAVEDTRQAIIAVDQVFVQTWTHGSLDAPQAQMQAMAQALAGAREPTLDSATYDQIVAQSRAVQAALEVAQTQANEQYADEMRRQTIVDAILDVLDGMQFNVGAQLADESNALGDVLVSAGHPSGQEISMRVDINRKINMNLEDGVKGADCVADVYNIIKGLQDAGIDLEMTDWGTADPDRVKQGGTYFSQGQGTRTGVAGS